MNDLDKIKKAYRLIIEIESIDKKLSRYNSYSEHIAKGNASAVLKISFILTAPAEKPEIFDKYGFLKSEYANPGKPGEPHNKEMISLSVLTPSGLSLPKDIVEFVKSQMQSYQGTRPDGATKNDCVFNEDIDHDDTTTLKLIAVIVNDLNERKKALTEKLRDLRVLNF
jgi:hypothetical protein